MEFYENPDREKPTATPLDELQLRLFNSFEVDPKFKDIPRDRESLEHRYSLRGMSWMSKSNSGGLYQDLFLGRRVTRLLKMLGKRYGTPLEVLIVALIMIGEARCSGSKFLEYVLYVPQRDSEGDQDSCGLFVDWRDVQMPVPKEASVAGILLELAHKVRNRDWELYNPVTSHDRTVGDGLVLMRSPRAVKEPR